MRIEKGHGWVWFHTRLSLQLFYYSCIIFAWSKFKGRERESLGMKLEKKNSLTQAEQVWGQSYTIIIALVTCVYHAIVYTTCNALSIIANVVTCAILNFSNNIVYAT